MLESGPGRGGESKLESSHMRPSLFSLYIASESIYSVRVSAACALRAFKAICPGYTPLALMPFKRRQEAGILRRG
jgi:hypothetical protein